MVKNLPANVGDAGNMGSVSGLGQSPGGRHGNPLQYSCMENPTDRGAWWSAKSVGVAESDATEPLSMHPWAIIPVVIYSPSTIWLFFFKLYLWVLSSRTRDEPKHSSESTES